MKSFLTMAGLITGVSLLLTSVAQAGNVYWTGGTANWSIGSNWDPAEPGYNDWTYINNGGTAQVTSPNYENSYRLYLGENSGDMGQIDVTGGSLGVTTYFLLGYRGKGMFNIKDGSVTSNYCYIGDDYNSEGKVTVDGGGSSWNVYVDLKIGNAGAGTLEIKNGSKVTTGKDGYIAFYDLPSSGKVTVTGIGSTWKIGQNLFAGVMGSGTLNITDGGLVSVYGQLNIDTGGNAGDSFINMASGGQLALRGNASNSIDDFLNLVSPYEGKDAIRYWNGSAWENITNATAGVDYTLEYLTAGDLAGYTLLNVVAVPEPSALAMLIVVLCGLLGARKRDRSNYR